MLMLLMNNHMLLKPQYQPAICRFCRRATAWLATKPLQYAGTGSDNGCLAVVLYA